MKITVTINLDTEQPQECDCEYVQEEYTLADAVNQDEADIREELDDGDFYDWEGNVVQLVPDTLTNTVGDNRPVRRTSDSSSATDSIDQPLGF